ncbi:MAG: nucleotide sugar dehydrogenase [Nitrospinota bacterium]|nr:nucleotide sugar dehydrogenase [Nitrospinota bacterium]
MPLIEEIRDRKVRAGVMGLGYVGLPLCLEFVRAGYHVVGLDSDVKKVESLRNRTSYITDISNEDLSEAFDTGRFEVTSDQSSISTVHTLNICVPTPLNKSGTPDLSFVKAALLSIEQNQRPGQLYILESTTYPGTTEEALLPMLSQGGKMEAGKDFFLAFSPERIDPGNPEFNTRNIPKVVGGVTKACTECAAALYSRCVDTIVQVNSPRVAEMVKLLENTFRSVNIGLVNELAKMCHNLDVNIWEVIDAAKTKPFGFMPFYPGPGLGGHCIPVDPIYLSWKARQMGFEARFIALADQVNSSMPQFVVDLVVKALGDRGKALNDSSILILGVTYKADVNDIRESPALDVWQLLESRGARVSYHDPYVDSLEFQGTDHVSQPLTPEILSKADCSVLLASHKSLDFDMVCEHSSCTVDTRNALSGCSSDGRIHKL